MKIYLIVYNISGNTTKQNKKIITIAVIGAIFHDSNT